mgnify:CR=1 FL=1
MIPPRERKAARKVYLAVVKKHGEESAEAETAFAAYIEFVSGNEVEVGD